MTYTCIEDVAKDGRSVVHCTTVPPPVLELELTLIYGRTCSTADGIHDFNVAPANLLLSLDESGECVTGLLLLNVVHGGHGGQGTVQEPHTHRHSPSIQDTHTSMPVPLNYIYNMNLFKVQGGAQWVHKVVHNVVHTG